MFLSQILLCSAASETCRWTCWVSTYSS